MSRHPSHVIIPVAEAERRLGFSDDELDVCSACGERATLRIPDLGTTICLACGLIRRHGGETSVDAVQRQARKASAA